MAALRDFEARARYALLSRDYCSILFASMLPNEEMQIVQHVNRCAALVVHRHSRVNAL
jgi:hypothetical protein